MFSKIIVAYDGRSHGEDALVVGQVMAQALGSSLLVASAYPHDLGTVRVPGYQAALREDATALARGGVGRLRQGVRAEARTAPGTSAARGLHDLAEAEDADLVVVGSSNRGRLGRAVAGTTAGRLLAGAPFSVLVAPVGYAGEHAPSVTAIGVGYDGTPEADHAVDVAAALARRVGAVLRIVSVLVPLTAPITGHPEFVASSTLLEAEPERREQVQGELDAAATRVGEGVEVQSSLRVGGPVDELNAAAEELDLLVLGSRGYGPVRRVLLGSVAGSVVRSAPAPVLVVPRPDVESSG